MSTEPPPKDPKDRSSDAPESDRSSSASKDLADGLNLMLNAAKKALKNVDSGKIEEVGRRALKNLETLDAKKVGKMGYKAAKNLDPRKIEEVAEEAGKELLNVMERVADRVERIATGAINAAKESKSEKKSEPPVGSSTASPPSPTAESTPKQDKPPPGDDAGAQKRVRVGD